ncbi:SUMF1/EgtB/PvdO family nonheme iron enzyme [Nitrosomonas sp. sh817]|uniref:nSTAND1 domain-containing NTPase n=1 Tax=Nitrosomonas sp. sh817 TaxID=3070658 RepID=UPI0027DBF521|nr:SUMF1/EgtB/PvdO family nonheme iron enzyme [Nitrosomonas sp. sh817]WMJ09914.1 SUMF1/EgtB/PvdO family nonheme iron enzyme [Nitrosomonas sp. sh817]
MRVYLSSTLNDLFPERQAVKEVLGGECVVVESYTADERSVRDSCLADVAGCELYIGIIGRRYGHIPDGENLSITELEYHQAVACNIPTLVFIKDDDEIKGKFHDAVTQENPPQLIEAFRQQIASRAAFFKTVEDLKARVVKAFFHHLQRHQTPQRKRIEGEPYPGLRAFRPEESDRFFGRDVEIEDLIERLLARNDRFIAVIGPSGSGKSSLVYAGLIPALSQSHAGGMRWYSVSFSPRELGDDPFLPLVAALNKAFPGCGWRVPDLSQRLRADPASISLIADEALQPQGANAQLLLFIDQFEELFAAKVDTAARDAYFRLLVAAAASPRLRVVVAMRSDFYGHWPQDGASAALLHSGHYSVVTPGAAALEKIIVEPAKAAGLTIAPRLVQRILNDTGTALALAEFALAQLYARKIGNELTEAAYDAIGGIAGAINGLAEEAVTRVQQANNLDEETFSRLFIAIANVEQRNDDDTGALAVVRRRARPYELSPPALLLAQQLIERRILVSRQDGKGQPAIIEVGHEAVFDHWQRFKDWHAHYADDLSLRRQAEQAAREWYNRQRSLLFQWHWERQKTAILALAQLHRLVAPALDADFSDPAIVVWNLLESQLEPPLRQFLYPEPLRLLGELNTDETTHLRREEIGSRLNQMGDPRRGVGLDEQGLPDITWIDIPAGELTLKTGDYFQFPGFRIARYPITWVQYRAFVDANDGYSNEEWWDGLKKASEPGDLLWASANYPAIKVSWYDAIAFCRWLSAKCKLPIRLPAEWEWQWAAVGNTKQDYPWEGKHVDYHGKPSLMLLARLNHKYAGINRTMAVGMYPLSRSLFGVGDMAGNIDQWCLNADGEPRNVSVNGDHARVVRGGSWSVFVEDARSATRNGAPPGARGNGLGFRVLCESPIVETLSATPLNAEKLAC